MGGLWSGCPLELTAPQSVGISSLRQGESNGACQGSLGTRGRGRRTKGNSRVADIVLMKVEMLPCSPDHRMTPYRHVQSPFIELVMPP